VSVAPALQDADEWARALWSWRRVLAPTALYCTSSVLLRPLTGERGPQWLMHRYFDSFVRRLGVRLHAYGTEKVADVGPCVITVNHNSLLDVPLVGAALPIDYKWVAKKEIFAVPFIGWHLRAAGHLWVDRGRHDNLPRLERQFHRVLADGGSILMFPEGTRSTDGALQAFRRGAFVTAVREGVPVLPVVLDGAERLLEKGSLRYPKGDKRVAVQVCDPIAPARVGDEGARVTALLQATRGAMIAALDGLRGEPGAALRATV
jgi:1-acyl-sn-glycerol-3-phosphate acyltransferase